MAIVRLEFDLDSDVYPELYGSLSALRSLESRAERLRQLAAAGLVWENVRIHGAGAIGPTAVAAAVPPAAPGVAAVAAPRPSGPAVNERAAAAEKRGKGARSARPPAEPPVKKDPRWGDFVDLAIDAEPVAARVPEPVALPLDRHAVVPRISPSDVEQVARELPVLRDVVDADEVVASQPAPLLDLPAAPPLYVVTAAVPPSGVSVPSGPHAGAPGAAETASGEGGAVRDEAVGASEDGIHLTSLAHKPATRSRLMRMKERGLFKNG